MEKSTTIHKNDQLLEARKEGLRQAENSSIRPHGKLWEMDVFSWYRPNIHVLTNTIHAFPFPVIWVANASDIKEVVSEDPNVTAQLDSIIAFDDTSLVMDMIDTKNIRNVIGTNAVEEALTMIKTVKRKSSVLLFSASDEEWKEKKEVFDGFLEENQKR